MDIADLIARLQELQAQGIHRVEITDDVDGGQFGLAVWRAEKTVRIDDTAEYGIVTECE